MSTDPSAAVRQFAAQFEAQLPADVVNDVLDWCLHDEWLLAVEVLTEKLFELQVGLDEGQRSTLADLVVQCGGDAARFAFILDPA